MESTPRTANQPTQQPSSRKNPDDRLCEQSLSAQMRAQRRHLVNCEVIVSRRLTNAERSKITKKQAIRSLYRVGRGSVAQN
jgi:hypothetical protein